jgi:putative ABC transport system ATP-binding protein
MHTAHRSDILSLKNIVKTYHLGETTVQALRETNLTLKKGEFTALIGKSGSGKSTLLNLIGCIDKPDSGQILFEDQDVTHFSEIQKSHVRNKKIGFIFQSFNLIPVLSVYENIELPLIIQSDITAEERNIRVMAALKDVELEEFAKYPPDKLSGGQRQRVAIARALVTHPTLVLADEPTANLDSKTSHKIIDLLLDLNRKKNITFLFCSHDEKLIDRVTRVVRIQDGVIVS